jgi:hypothetical protein
LGWNARKCGRCCTDSRATMGSSPDRRSNDNRYVSLSDCESYLDDEIPTTASADAKAQAEEERQLFVSAMNYGPREATTGDLWRHEDSATTTAASMAGPVPVFTSQAFNSSGKPSEIARGSASGTAGATGSPSKRGDDATSTAKAWMSTIKDAGLVALGKAKASLQLGQGEKPTRAASGKAILKRSGALAKRSTTRTETVEQSRKVAKALAVNSMDV